MRLPTFLRLNSLRKQLIATYVIALLIATIAVFTLVRTTLGGSKHALTEKGLAMQARWIEEGLQYDPKGQPIAVAGDRAWVYQSAPHDLKYRVLDSSGHVLLASDPNGLPLGTDRLSVVQQPLSGSLVDGVNLYVLTVPETRPSGPFFIQIARSERLDLLARRALIMPLLQVALWVELGSLALFAFAVYFAVSRMLIPLRAASRAAQRIEPNNLSARLEARYLPAEIAPLIGAFNSALGRLERGYMVQRSFIAGAAHELKTPLALIRAQIELSPGLDHTVLLRDVDLMARQVHQLLHLAEVSEAQNYAYAQTDAASVTCEVANHLHRLADKSNVTLQVIRPTVDVQCNADRSALFILLKNLVENAIRHSPAGSVITLYVDAGGIEVRDRGDGIADEDLPHLFERFWRGSKEREGGAGLGLAICHEIASVHGWSIVARNVDPGALFRLQFDGRQPSAQRSGSLPYNPIH